MYNEAVFFQRKLKNTFTLTGETGQVGDGGKRLYQENEDDFEF